MYRVDVTKGGACYRYSFFITLLIIFSLNALPTTFIALFSPIGILIILTILLIVW